MDGDKLVTDSRRVAAHFGRRHADVLRAVKRLECSPEYRQRNFALTMGAVPGPKGALRQEPTYQMTKDGFVFLVMGFGGERAAAIKEAYINAFNSMAEALQKRDLSLWQQMQALIAKESASQVKAAFGSRLMLHRKRELPALRREEKELKDELQPGLFNKLRTLS